MIVTNNRPGPATSVRVGFLMPWGTSFVSADPDATVFRSFLSWPRVTLAAGASVTYTIQLTAPSGPGASHLVAFGGAVSLVRDPNPLEQRCGGGDHLDGSGRPGLTGPTPPPPRAPPLVGKLTRHADRE